MLFKLLIVDDEEDIREGLADMIDWHALGFEVVAKLKDGKDAIEYIQSDKVDVVLTDIKMNVLSGLDLAKYIHENHLDIKIVFLSGYQEFDLAKQAINYNVVHYLLKPTDLDEVSASFQKLKTTMEREREEQDKLDHERRQYKDMIPMLQEQLFSDLVAGMLRSRQEIEKRMKLAGLKVNMELGKCWIAHMQIRNYSHYIDKSWKHGKDRLITAIRNILKGSREGVEYIPMQAEGGDFQLLAVAVHSMSMEDFQNTVGKYLQKSGNSLKNLLGLEVIIRRQETYNNLFECAQSYHKSFHPAIADSLEDYKLEKMIDAGELKKLAVQKKGFISYALSGNLEAGRNLLETFIDELCNMDIRVLQNFIVDLFTMLMNELLGDNTYEYSILQEKIYFSELFSLKDTTEISDWCNMVFNKITESLEKSKKKSEKNVIKKVKKYIEENFDRDVSLEEAADNVFLSSVYLGRLFKKETGESFTDYIIRVRMEKAIEYLREGKYKVYQISTMVGYNNIKYFYKLFKKYTGLTPSEYKR